MINRGSNYETFGGAKYNRKTSNNHIGHFIVDD